MIGWMVVGIDGW